MLDPAPQPEGDRGGAVAAARRSDPAQDGRAGGRARQSGQLRFGRHGRIRRRAGPQLLLPRDEHAPAGRASGDGTRHRRRPRRGDDPQRLWRAVAPDPGRREAEGLGGREPRLRRGPDARLPAFDRAAGQIPPAGGRDRRGRHGAQRHRRLRGRRNLDLLRSDDRQAGHPRRRPSAARSRRRRTRSTPSSSTASATTFPSCRR